MLRRFSYRPPLRDRWQVQVGSLVPVALLCIAVTVNASGPLAAIIIFFLGYLSFVGLFLFFGSFVVLRHIECEGTRILAPVESVHQRAENFDLREVIDFGRQDIDPASIVDNAAFVLTMHDRRIYFWRRHFSSPQEYQSLADHLEALLALAPWTGNLPDKEDFHQIAYDSRDDFLTIPCNDRLTRYIRINDDRISIPLNEEGQELSFTIKEIDHLNVSVKLPNGDGPPSPECIAVKVQGKSILLERRRCLTAPQFDKVLTFFMQY